MSKTKTNCFRILAVDDEQLILDLYKKIFSPPRDIGESLFKILNINDRTIFSSPLFDLVLCREGKKAVEAVRVAIEENHPFVVAFLDLHLPPGPNGVWTAENIRKIDPSIEIVLVTGHSEFEFGEIARKVLPPHKMLYLRKPFYPQEIWQFACALGAKWEDERRVQAIHKSLDTLVDKRTSALSKANKKLKRETENRIRVNNSLIESEKKFRNIIVNNTDCIVIVDRNGIVRFTNPAAELLLGHKANELIGASFGFPVIAGETTELDIIKENGDTAVAEMRMVETEWEGEIAYLASLRDITHHKLMETQILQSRENLLKAMKGIIQAMAFAVETRDPYTAGHQQRVADLAHAIAEEMGLSLDQIDGILMVGIIHDLGKMSVPAEILSKPVKLNEMEFGLIKKHPRVGYEILKEIEFPWPIAQIVLQHHERMDGSGYPSGLSGEDILLEARILAVADVVEAMASHRPYREALGLDKALEEISKNQGILYDPNVVVACLRLFKEKGFKFLFDLDRFEGYKDIMG